MKPINTITGSLVPLPRANVDTDQIMPKMYLKRVERTGYGEFLFAEWKAADADFVLNRPEYRGAKILVTGANFGVRSHRCSLIRRHLPAELHQDRSPSGRTARQGSGVVDGTG